MRMLSFDLVDSSQEQAVNKVNVVGGINGAGEGDIVGKFKRVRKGKKLVRGLDDELGDFIEQDDSEFSDVDSNEGDDDLMDFIEEDDSKNSDEDYEYPLSDGNEDESDDSNDGLSSYESDDEDGRQSNDEEGQPKSHIDITKFGKEFHVNGDDGKVILKKDLLFENVDKFREALKEYTIQK